MSAIVNLTMSQSTPEQMKEGLLFRTPEQNKTVIKLLTFDTLPSTKKITNRARKLADMAIDILGTEGHFALINGPSYLMGILEVELENRGIQPLHSFIKKKKIVERIKDEPVKTVTTFNHGGFVAIA